MLCLHRLLPVRRSCDTRVTRVRDRAVRQCRRPLGRLRLTCSHLASSADDERPAPAMTGRPRRRPRRQAQVSVRHTLPSVPFRPWGSAGDGSRRSGTRSTRSFAVIVAARSSCSDRWLVVTIRRTATSTSSSSSRRAARCSISWISRRPSLNSSESESMSSRSVGSRSATTTSAEKPWRFDPPRRSADRGHRRGGGASRCVRSRLDAPACLRAAARDHTCSRTTTTGSTSTSSGQRSIVEVLRDADWRFEVTIFSQGAPPPTPSF